MNMPVKHVLGTQQCVLTLKHVPKLVMLQTACVSVKRYLKDIIKSALNKASRQHSSSQQSAGQ
jgi:hypothetical protein